MILYNKKPARYANRAVRVLLLADSPALSAAAPEDDRCPKHEAKIVPAAFVIHFINANIVVE